MAAPATTDERPHGILRIGCLNVKDYSRLAASWASIINPGEDLDILHEILLQRPLNQIQNLVADAFAKEEQKRQLPGDLQ